MTIDDTIDTDAIAVDATRDVLYWGERTTNEIKKADLDGNGVGVLVPADVPNVDGLAVDEATGRVFWTEDHRARSTGSDGMDTETLIARPDLRSLAYHDGLDRLYFVDIANQVVAFTSPFGTSTTIVADTSPSFAGAVTIDEPREKIYWCTGAHLYRADLLGHDSELVGVLVNASDIEIDPLGERIYWCDRFAKRISRARITPGGLIDTETLYTTTGTTERFRLSLIPESGELVWCEWTSIKRGAMDGSTAAIDGPVTFSGMSSVKWNSDDEMVYWTELGGKVRRAAFGGATETLYDMSGHDPEELVIQFSPTVGVAPAAETPRVGHHVAVPNPFRAQTAIHVDLSRGGLVHARLFDAQGRLVRVLADGRFLPEGAHTLSWDGTDVQGRPAPAGVYYYSLRSAVTTETGSVVRLP